MSKEQTEDMEEDTEQIIPPMGLVLDTEDHTDDQGQSQQEDPENGQGTEQFPSTMEGPKKSHLVHSEDVQV